jgi:AraC-like DNA-binding protein
MRIPSRWRVNQRFPREHLFYFPTDGRLAGQLADGAEFTTQPGELLWVPADTPFQFWLPEGEKLSLCRFRLSVNRELSAPDVVRFPGAGACRLWMEQLATEAEAALPHQTERVRGLLLCLFTELVRLGTLAETATGGLTTTQVDSLRTLVAERGASGGWLAPADLARHLRLSPDYFTRLFTRTLGIPPRRWLLEQRIRLAALRLEESQLNVTEVAAEFGYENVFLFSRQFRQVMARSPLEYRRRRRPR